MDIIGAIISGKYPPFGLRNKNLESVTDDFLYHFGFGNKTMDIPKVFGDTKNVDNYSNAAARVKIQAIGVII
ncbi:hypothetical protein ANCDUO_04579 [Ancylostoma duodenale]|uniref:Uncharacterized protein n=1 Tax=Ancylostoma duodenale TaxID=51022 RepID=A0A0C2DQV7_9BILA|nr:hypothetical protein ANCDUO_04579 [Ancylostoma duodenale]